MDKRGISISLAAVFMVQLCTAGVSTAATPCEQSLAGRIPARPATALTGRELAHRFANIGDDERETLIQRELLAGNIPDGLRHLRPVALSAVSSTGTSTRMIVCVMPDYLALGSDDDFLLMPMRLRTALVVAERFGFTLPTPKLVDAIYAQSVIHLNPQPLPASPDMRSTAYYLRHNEIIRAQRAGSSTTPALLMAGHKKDLVLTNRLWQNLERVAIYGWQRANGRPIQPLSTVHGWRYADYSHGVRFVSTEIRVDGRSQSLFRALEDPHLAAMLSGEGLMRNIVGLVDTLTENHRAALANLAPDARHAAARIGYLIR